MSAKDNFSQAVKELIGSEPARQPEKPAVPTQTPVQTRAAASYPSVTVLAADTVILGDVHTGGDLRLEGSIKGNVVAKGDITACGKIIGNVTGSALTLTNCSIKGDVTSTALLEMNGNAMVLGGVFAKSALLDGKIKGDLRVEEATTLNPSAVVLGNI